MKNLFFGFWDSNTHIDNIQMKQIIMWAKSILFFNPNVEIKLYTKRNIIRENLINIEKMEIVYVNNFEELLTNTPLEGYTINKTISKPELSDIIRLCLLYKYGGTWLDIDDIVVRKFPTKKNILGSFLWYNNKNKANYWGSTFNLVDGMIVSKKYKNYGFHIQNDPMINWEKGNKFLYRWMENIKIYKSYDWGQKVPTEIIRKNINIIIENEITLIPQHNILLHPAFGNNLQFGYPNSKGPMFPPYDLRISGKVNYDDMLSKKEFWGKMNETLKLHDYCCIKNSKNTGIKQCENGGEKRWLIGHLCDIENFDDILCKLKQTIGINLMIVAHPDDELLFGWKELIKSNNWVIICLTHGNDVKRSSYFKQVMKKLNLNYIMYNFPDIFSNLYWNISVRNNIKQLINIELNKREYVKIITHNPAGEYGHYHHRMVSKIITNLMNERNEKNKLYYFNFDINDKEELPIIYEECLNIYFEKSKQDKIKPLKGMKELSKISSIIRQDKYEDKTIYNKDFFSKEFLNSIIIKFNKE